MEEQNKNSNNIYHYPFYARVIWGHISFNVNPQFNGVLGSFISALPYSP